MSKIHNIAIVGCGAIAQTHLRALRKSRNFKIVAACDMNRERVHAVCKAWKVKHYYTDISEMLDGESISTLSILTPPSSHASLATEALKRGMNVVIEKPLTMSTEAADSIISALRESSAKMTVVYHWLFSEAMLKVLSLLQRNETGEILHVDVKVLGHAHADPMTSDPHHWSHTLRGGRFGEMLSHPIYILQSILGDELRTEEVLVSKRGSIPWMPKDELIATLQGMEGVGSLYVSFNAPRGSITVDIYGTKKILKIDLTRQMVLQLGPRKPFSKIAIARDAFSETSRLLFLTINNAVKYSFPGRSNLAKVYTMFLNYIEDNVTPIVTPRMAYNTVKIVEDICNDIDTTAGA